MSECEPTGAHLRVLLATYNDQRWLDEQLGSSFASQGALTLVVASDDSAGDGMSALLERRWRETDVTLLQAAAGHFDSAHHNLLRQLAFRPNSVGVRVNEQTVSYCRQRGHEARVIQGDELPFESASFDSVLRDNVLEHFAEPASLLAEVRHTLPSGGRLLIGVPAVRGWHADPDHKLVYDLTTMVNRLGSAGFTPVRVFHTRQMRSDSMSRRLRQYCIYGAFDRT